MKQHLLVVDDEASIREMLTQFFTLKGYRVTATASPEEAIRTVKEDRPDLVISDIQMEKTDGLALIDLLRDVDSALPVMVLTGVILDEDTARGNNLRRIASYVSKTSSLQEVLIEVRRLLQAGAGND